mgnify:CR=1 FL=1
MTFITIASSNKIDNMEEFPENSLIRVHGLKKRPDLNNTLGVVQSQGDIAPDRLRVKPIEASGFIAVKPANLMHCSETMREIFSRSAEREDPNEEFASTLVVSLTDMSCSGVLPDISTQNHTLQIILIGASFRYEMEINFTTVLNELKRRVYPTLKAIDVVLCGPELTNNKAKREVSPGVFVTYVARKFEDAYPKTSNLQGAGGCMVSPGFTSFLDTWTPAINRVMDLNLPTVLTCYSCIDRITDDALFDEDSLVRYFGAHVVVSTSKNPHFSFHNGKFFKNAYYIVFRGKSSLASEVVIPPNQFKIQMLAGYMRFQGDFYSHDKYFQRMCNEIAANLESGKLPFRNQTTAELIRMANGM